MKHKKSEIDITHAIHLILDKRIYTEQTCSTTTYTAQTKKLDII